MPTEPSNKGRTLSLLEILAAAASALFLLLWIGFWIAVFAGAAPSATPDQISADRLIDRLAAMIVISAPISVAANTYALLWPRQIPAFVLIVLWSVAAIAIFLLAPFWLALIPIPPLLWSALPLVRRSVNHLDEDPGLRT